MKPLDQHEPAWELVRTPGAIHALAITFLCEFLIAALALSVTRFMDMGPWQVFAGAVISLSVTLFILWFETKRNSFEMRLVLRLFGQDAGQVALLACIAVSGFTTVLAVAMWLEPILPIPSWFEDMLRTLLSARTLPEFIGLLAGGVVMTAVGEELLFRGWLQGSLEESIGKIKGLALTSLLFGVFHDPWRLVPATLLGLLIGVIVMRSGSILAGMILHVINNLLVITLMSLETAGKFSEDPIAWLKRPEMTALSAALLAFFVWRYWQSGKAKVERRE